MSLPTGPEYEETEDLHLHNHGTPLNRSHGTLAAAAPEGDQVGKKGEMSTTPTLVEEGLSEDEKPKGLAFGLIILGLYLAIFLFCLDISIVAPAIPVITNDFHDTSKATWFFSVYLALNTAFQPIAGPFFRLNAKWSFLIFLFIFEIGSLICAVAPSSDVFIFGRALAGVGTAGGYVGSLVIIATISPVGESAKWVNGVGAIYSLGAVAGPLIGGSFVSKVTWRWCFYINLPIGGLTLVACFFLLPSPKHSAIPFKQRFLDLVKDLDFVGITLVLAALMMMLIAFQWGGIKYNWGNSIIIGLIIGFILTTVVIIVWVHFRGENGYVRPRLMRNRSIAASMACNFAIAGAYLTLISILAYYFQIRGSSALRSGVQLLPMIAGVVTSLVLGGGLAPVVGYTNPFLLAGMVIMEVMLGALTLLSVTSSTAFWAGLTFAFGFGAGLCFMMPFLLSQTILEPEDLEIGSAMVLFMQTLGGAIVFAIGQAIYQNRYSAAVKALPGLADAENIVNGGVTAFRTLAPPEFVPIIEEIAVKSVVYAFYTPIALLGLAILVAFPFAEWRSIKPPPKEEKDAKDAEKITA